MGVRGLVRTFVTNFEMSLLASSDIFSEYKADVDMSYYKSYYSDPRKIKLNLYARGFEENHVEEKFVLEIRTVYIREHSETHSGAWSYIGNQESLENI